MRLKNEDYSPALPIDAAEVQRFVALGVPKARIARQLGCNRNSVYMLARPAG